MLQISRCKLLLQTIRKRRFLILFLTHCLGGFVKHMWQRLQRFVHFKLNFYIIHSYQTILDTLKLCLGVTFTSLFNYITIYVKVSCNITSLFNACYLSWIFCIEVFFLFTSLHYMYIIQKYKVDIICTIITLLVQYVHMIRRCTWRALNEKLFPYSFRENCCWRYAKIYKYIPTI